MIFAIPLSEMVKNLFFSLALGFFCIWWFSQRKGWPRLGLPGWGLLGFLGVGLLAAWTALSPWEGLRGAWDVARFSLCYLMILNGPFSTSSKGRGLILVLILSSLVIGSFWGLFELWWGFKEAFQVHSLGHENHTATYVLMGLLTALAGAWHWRHSKGTFLGFGSVAALLTVALLLTYSRSAFLTFLAILVIAAFCLRRWPPLAGAVALILAVSLLTKFDPNLRSFQNLLIVPQTAVSQNIRWSYWKGSVEIIRDFPLTGIGLRNFKYASQWGYKARANHAHSLYFNIAAESGLLGLEALTVLLGVLFYSWYRDRKQHTDPLALTIHWAALGAWLTIVINGLMTTTLHTESAMLLLILFGLSECNRSQTSLASNTLPSEIGP
jgi:O-antigen ligase